MQNVPKILVAVAALSFLAGVAVVLSGGTIANIPAESFSRAANNLTLIAIALLLIAKKAARLG